MLSSLPQHLGAPLSGNLPVPHPREPAPNCRETGERCLCSSQRSLALSQGRWEPKGLPRAWSMYWPWVCRGAWRGQCFQ